MRIRASSACALILLCASTFAYGAESVETFRVNLDPLIDRAAQHPSQFAVDVARRVTSGSSGRWQINASNATWDYAIRIPTAVSMAFHASRLSLPVDGTLTISAGDQTYVYLGRDLHRREFWSRLAKGDQIALHIEVPKAERYQTRIEIASFQAGYKSLAPGLEDNAHFKAIKTRAAQSSSAGCVENYVCDATSATQTAANSSVALTIANTYECSGTLLNDVPQDGAPFVLTARHCENGQDGGGDPAAASSVEIYWNAVTPCGQTLTSIFDASAQVQSGATTVVEQQDQWLIRLDALPAAANAYYSGWDASGAALVGGFTVDYANADTQQYVTWAGAAITETLSPQTLSVGYSSTYWGVVNSLGSIDHGASGSGLFNANNQLVGSASRASVAQCPVNPPPAPGTNTVVAIFNQLASTWSSTADATSTTGPATIAAALDPANSGATAIAGVAGPPPAVTLVASQTTAQTGTNIFLEFEFTAGAVCTASGGSSGDGWAGPVSASVSGSQSITDNQAGGVTYVLTCTIGSRLASAQVTVVWSLAAPALSFLDTQPVLALYAGVANTLAWSSNQSACTPTGGSSGDGWSGALAGSGQANVTENQPGTYSYTLTCGSGGQAISQSLTLTYLAPTASIALYDPSPGLRSGQAIALQWTGSGACAASGGGSGDGWAGPIGAGGIRDLTETTPGTYTYTISCGPAAVAAVAQVSYTFSGAAPSAVLTATQPTQLINLTVTAYPTLLSWSANVEPCALDYTGPTSGSLSSGYPAQGSINQPQQIAGLYTYTLTCGSGADQATGTATIHWTQPTPQVSLNALGSEFLLTGGYLTWTTNVLPCIGSGGTAGDGWTGTLNFLGLPGSSSSTLVKESTPGTYTFTITCGAGTVGTSQATVVFNNAGGSQLTFAAATPQVFTGQPIHLSWNSALSPCTAYGGSGTDGWNGAQPAQSSVDLTESVQNSYTFTLVCGSGTQAVEAQAPVYVAQATQIQINWGSNPYAAGVTRPATFSWQAYEAVSCIATGGNPGDGWSGSLPATGSATVTESMIGSVNYMLTCQNGAISGQSTWTVKWEANPAVTLTSSTLQAVFGTPFTLSWSTSNGATACLASEDGGLNGVFNGPEPDSGSAMVQETSGTTHTYTMSCSGNFGTTQAQVTVNFTAAAGTGGSGSGGGGSSGGSSGGSHGGDLDPAMLAFIAMLAALRISARHRSTRR